MVKLAGDFYRKEKAIFTIEKDDFDNLSITQQYQEGDDSGVDLFIDATTGQVSYTSSNFGGTVVTSEIYYALRNGKVFQKIGDATSTESGLVSSEAFSEQTGLSVSAAAGTGATLDVTIAKVGKVCTAHYKITAGTSPTTGTVTASSVLPAWAIPKTNQYGATSIYNFANTDYITPRVLDNGDITFVLRDTSSGAEVTWGTTVANTMSWVVD